METIETPRLILRPMDADDTQSIFDILCDPATAWWADVWRMYNRVQAYDFINWANRAPEMEQYGMVEKESGRLVGFIQVKLPGMTGVPRTRELGYALSKDHRRKGFMSEAVQAVCGRLFAEPDVDAVSLEIHLRNEGSLGVARRCGFRHWQQAGGVKERRWLDGEPLDRFILTRPEKSDHRAA